MRDIDYAGFSKIFVAAWKISGKQPEPEMVEMAFELLRAYSLDEIMLALKKHMVDPDHGQFPPKPADIIRQLQGPSEERSLAAWAKVMAALSRIGPYQSVVFDDPAIHGAIALMRGWIRLGNLSDDESPFVAKEFQTHYRMLVRQERYQYPGVLIGIMDEQNNRNGYPISKPRIVGDPAVAAQVRLHGGDISAVPLLEGPA